MKSPAFQFYPNEFLGSGAVARMTPAEVGVYVLLLCYDWNEGGIPDDLSALARMVRVPEKAFRKMWLTIDPHFVYRDGRRYNPRLELERRKQEEYRTKMSENGRRGGRPKAEAKPPESRSFSTEKPIESIAVTSSTPSAKPPTPSAYPAEFERAFQAMPKRAGGHPKKTAYRAWQASVKRGADVDAIEAGARRYALFIAAINRTGTEYVKMASTFFGPDDLWLDAWDVPLTVSRGSGKAEANTTDPNAPNYATVENGVPNDAFLRLIGSVR